MERKPYRYWKDFGNTVTELYKALEQHNLDFIPGTGELYNMGHASLSRSIEMYHPELKRVLSEMSPNRRERLQHKFEKSIELCDAEKLIAWNHNPERLAIIRENLEIILGMLEESQRAAVEMKHQGYIFEEIGSNERITKQAAHAKYNRSLDIIRGAGACWQMYEDAFAER